MEPAAGIDLAILTEPATVAHPYPVYDRLRADAPLFGYRDYPPGTVPGMDLPQPAWVVLSFEQVAAIAYDHERFSSRDSLQESSSAPTLMLVNHDRPEHARLRKIAAKVFQPSAITSFQLEARKLAAETMDEFLVGNGPVEVMAGYCAMLPARIMAVLLGIDPALDRQIRDWATGFMLSEILSPAERQTRNLSLQAFFDTHVRSFLAMPDSQRPAAPLLRAFLETEVDGERLSLEEAIRFCLTVTVAGAETTSFHLGNMFAAFADEPGVFARYSSDTSCFGAIFLEILRKYGPPQRLFRVATQDVTIGRALIRRGDWVACFFGAANYDPDVFPDPYRFDIDRPNLARQMSFGYGIHRCLGAPLAKLELEVTAQLLRERYAGIERAAPAQWQTASLLNHGLTNNTLRLVPHKA